MAGAMREKLPWILLAVSLALNLGFAVGAFHYAEIARPAGAAESLADRLALDAGQRAALDAFRDRARARRAERRADRGDWRRALIEELAKPQLQRAALDETLRQGMERRRAFFEETAVDLHGFIATLSPDQKADFLAMAEERGFMRSLVGFRRDGGSRR